MTYVDFEDGADGIMDRLAEMVIDPASITKFFHYIRPEGPLTDATALLRLTQASTLVIVDGVTEAMTMHGLNPLDNADVAKFNNLLVNPIASLGSAVVSLDHVVKDATNRGRYQIGGVHKLNAISGVSYLLANEQPFGRGMVGKSRLMTSKDRPGHVRQHGVRDPKNPAVTHVADLVVNNRNPEVATEVTLTPPSEHGDWRPHHLMARASSLLAGARESGRYSKTSLAMAMGGKKATALQAVDFLIQDGYASSQKVGNVSYIVHVREYTEPGQTMIV